MNQFESYKLHSITPIDNLGKKDIQNLNFAIKVAKKSLFTSSKKMGSIFCKGGKKCTSGENQHRQFYRRTKHISLHCEVHTIMNVIKKKNMYSLTHPVELNGTIYIVRLMNSICGKSHKIDYLLGNSKPCKNCFKYLELFKVKKIKYTDILYDEKYLDRVNVLVELRLP